MMVDTSALAAIPFDEDKFVVTPAAAVLGAEIGGVDAGPGLSERNLQRIRDALLRYSVVVLRDQRRPGTSHLPELLRRGLKRRLHRWDERFRRTRRPFSLATSSRSSWRTCDGTTVGSSCTRHPWRR